MSSLTTDILIEYTTYKDQAIHHANCMADLWMELKEKTPEQYSKFKQIVRAQKQLAKKLTAFRVSLEESYEKLTHTLLEQQSQLPAPETNITIQQFYENLSELANIPAHTDTITVDPTSEGTQQ